MLRGLRGGREPTGTFHPLWATLLLTFLNVAVFLASRQAVDPDAAEKVQDLLVLRRKAVWSGEWWRVFTSQVAHDDWHHLLSNCGGMIVFGLLLEPGIGTVRLLALAPREGGGSRRWGFHRVPGWSRLRPSWV